MNIKHVLSCLVVALMLAGCGNKGPLVMPQKPVPVEQPVPAVPAPATVEPAPPAGPPAPPAQPATGEAASDG